MARARKHDHRITLYNNYREIYPKDKCTQYRLAKIMHLENPKIFKTVESARDTIRGQEGNKGQSMRDASRDKSNYKKLTHNTSNEIYRQDEVFGKVLILDIETAPLLANLWGIWNQNISTDNIKSDWFMLTWAGKWLFENKVYSARVTPKEAQKNDDRRIVRSLVDMVSKADIVITHNGDRFDLPRINTRAIINKIAPPLPYISIDTLKVAKRHFAFTSNKLDYINKQLGLPQKTETNMELWRDCFHGDENALRKMEKYNINDVRIHEQTYLTMRPFIRPHPNIGLHIIDQHERCPSCGGKDITDVGKLYFTTMNCYEMFRCKCGAIGRRKKALKKSGKISNSPAR